MNYVFSAGMKSLLCSCLLLTGCSDGSDTNSGQIDQSRQISTHGEIEVRQLSNQGLDFHAVFLSMDAPFSTFELINEYEIVIDRCEVYSGTPSYYENPYSLREQYGLPISFGGFTTISAGDEISFIDNNDALFYVLYEFADVDFARYSHDIDPYDDQQIGSAYVIPNGLTIDITGRAFPAFDNISVPDISELVVYSPVNMELVQQNTRFIWEPSKMENGYIRLLGTNATKTFECRVEDDGEFEFSNEIKNMIGIDFEATDVLFARTELSLYQKDDSTLLVKRTNNYIHARDSYF